LFGVFGNNDVERDALAAASERHGFRFVDPPLELRWGGRRLVVVHDPHEHAPDLLHSGDVLLHGHDHTRRLESVDRTLVFNPGECAGHLEGHNAVGTLDLSTLDPQLLLF
ncbi:MAG: metallophosphoesterase family protein, partial [Myxococcota bacterium]